MFSTTATKEVLQAFYHCTIHPTPLKATPKLEDFASQMFGIIACAVLIIFIYITQERGITVSRQMETLKLEIKDLEKARKDMEEKLNAAKEEIKAAAETQVVEKREKEADDEYEVLVDGKGA